VIHIDTCIMTSGHTMGIFKECWIFPPQIIHYGSSSEEQRWAKPKISEFQEPLLTCIIWNRVLIDSDMGNILQPPTWPHTHTHTQTHPQSGYVPWILSIIV
jgi:hypothetical protein